MRWLRPLLGNPVTLITLAILAGFTIHVFTSFPEDSDPDGDDSTLILHDLPNHGPLLPQSTAKSAHPGHEMEYQNIPLPFPVDNLHPVPFREVWAYLMAGEDKYWKAKAPITDICLFNFKLDDTGHVIGSLSKDTLALARRRGIRTHLVIASAGQKTLMHFLMNANYRAQNRLLGEIIQLVKRYPTLNGLQIDFESFLSEDRWHFISFLKKLRSELPKDLMFSLALPARTKVNPSDALRYRGLDPLADRFLIMVYDQHWKGGEPGSIASKSWHDSVVDHAKAELQAHKIVICLPFYGRIWQVNKSLARATKHRNLHNIFIQTRSAVQYDFDKTNKFTFEKIITAEGWFEDAASLYSKFSSAKSRGVDAIGFWRIGQEDERVWGLIAKEE